MTKQEALRILFSTAKQYHDNLENKNILFLFENKSGIQSFEASFFPRNYLHLTGVKLLRRLDSSHFFKMCLDKRLSVSDFNLHTDGTTELKLSVLPKLFNIQHTARMIGDHDESNLLLITDKIVGTVYACIGFVQDENGYYIPNTAMREDIRNVTRNPQSRILGTMIKPMTDDYYSTFAYIAKDVSADYFAEFLRGKYVSEETYEQ